MAQAVDDALASLGESARAAIYFHIERSSSIRKEEIPERLGDLSAAIGKIFGEGGLVLEKLILTKLCERLQVGYGRVEGMNFASAVEELRKLSAGTQ